MGTTCALASCRDTLEPNNDAENATVVQTDMPYDGLFICGSRADDQDYYTFDLPQGQPFWFELFFIDAEGDIDVSITSNEMSVGSGSSTTDNEIVYVSGEESGGTYRRRSFVSIPAIT